MKLAIRIGLAALAVLAMAGTANVTTATAGAPLCKAAELPCGPESKYPLGTEVHLTSIGAGTITMNVEGESRELSCTGGSVDAEIVSTPKLGFELSFSGWELGACEETFTNAACSDTAENLPYLGGFSWTSASNGTLTVREATGGQPGWRIQCEEAVIDCTYSLESGFDLEGGSPAILTASAAQLGATPNKEAGCPGSEPRLSVAYQVESPNPLFINGADSTNVRRDGSRHNANFDNNGIDDYRVDADIAVLARGAPPPGDLEGITFVHRTDCLYPDPYREWSEPEAYEPPDPEDPDWRPNSRLNAPGETTPYGCLENSGDPPPAPLVPGIIGRAARRDGFNGLGGVAPGARVWSVRVVSESLNFGQYPNPEHEENPEAPKWLPELGTEHVISGLDWVADHADQIEVVYLHLGCAKEGLSAEVAEQLGNPPECADPVLKEAIGAVIDKGVVVILPAAEGDVDVENITPQNDPGVITVSAVIDTDGRPGGTSPGSGFCADIDDQRQDYGSGKASNYGMLVDIGSPMCADTGSASKIAGAAAALASQCNPSSRADVEFIVDTLMAEGDTGEIPEGGWKDTSGDGWKEPLLNLHDEDVIDPVLLASPSNPEGVDEEPDPGGCEWRSHQAESDVGSDGRADLVTVDSYGDAHVFAGKPEGYETGNPTTSLAGQVDPALIDAASHYAIDTADVDGDRHADLVTAVDGEGVYVHPGGDGDGFGSGVQSLQGKTLSFEGPEGELEPIAVADVNGDERADLVAHSRSEGGRILTFPGQDGGTFGTQLDAGLSVDSALLDAEGHYFLDVIDVTGEELDEPGAEPIDYNARHSNADLVAVDSDGSVYVYEGQASGKFAAPVAAAQVDPNMDDGEGQEPIGLGDVDRDRRADLLTLDGGTLKLYKAQRDLETGAFSFAAPVEPYAGSIDSSLLDGEGQELIGLRDYSRDGLADLVSVDEEGTLRTYTANRDFTFAAPAAQAGSIPSVRADGGPGHEFVGERPLVRRLGCNVGGCEWKPPARHTPRLEAESYPATLAGSGPASLSIPEHQPIECTDGGLEGQLSSAGASLGLDAEYAGCSVEVSGEMKPVLVEMNSCSYSLDVLNQGPPYAAELGITCAEEGDVILFSVYSSSSYEFRICKVALPAQQGLQGVDLANAGQGAERAIDIDAEMAGVSWEQSGLCGPASGNDGVLAADAALAGSNGASEQLGAYLSGAELPGLYLDGAQAEAEAEQPRFESDGYPRQIAGAGPASFSVPDGTIECPNTGFAGEIAQASTSFGLELSSAGCMATASSGLEYPTDMHMNSCSYSLDILNQGPPYKGSLGISCAEEGDVIEYMLYSSETKEFRTCIITVGPQQGLQGVKLANVGQASERKVAIDVDVGGVAWEQSGLCEAQSGSGGTLNATVTLAGAE